MTFSLKGSEEKLRSPFRRILLIVFYVEEVFLLFPIGGHKSVNR